MGGMVYGTQDFYGGDKKIRAVGNGDACIILLMYLMPWNNRLR